MTRLLLALALAAAPTLAAAQSASPNASAPGSLPSNALQLELLSRLRTRLDSVIAEAAVVEVPGRPYAIAVMTTYLASDERGSDVIEAIAGEVYRTMARLGSGGEYGRKLP